MDKDYKTIYEQRYETYRHLDRLRWFIFQIAISIVGIIISLFSHLNGSMILGTGLILLSAGLIMLKINHGIDANNIPLREVAIKIGDKWIPNIHSRYKLQSTSWLISYSLIIMGVLMSFYGILPFICNLFIN